MGSAGLQFDAEDGVSSARLNQKTLFVGTGAQISGATTYAGMLAYCTSTGSGFVADVCYERNAANTAWTPVGVDQLAYLKLSTTISDYSQPASATASSTDSGTRTVSFSDDFSGADSWVDNHANFGVNTTTDVFDFNDDGVTTNYASTYDLGAGNVSDSAWVLRFKIDFDVLTAATNAWISLGISSVTTGGDVAEDFIGMLCQYEGTAATKTFHSQDRDGTTLNVGSVDNNAGNDALAVGIYYIQIRRLTTTTYDVKIYSDSTYTTLLYTLTGTCNATTASLRYIKFMNNNVAHAGQLQGTIDDVKFWNGITDAGFGASNAVDDVTTTDWKSASVANPAIYVDLTSDRELVALALNINKTATTITSFKVRATSSATGATFSDSDNIAYLNVSDFTDDTWRFLANNFLSENKRYVQFYANETGVFSINEIKARYGVTDLRKIMDHRHRTRSTTAADSYVDSN